MAKGRATFTNSSDHIILDSKNRNLKAGDEVNFKLDYGGILAGITNPTCILKNQ